jgi:hypothetical protein
MLAIKAKSQNKPSYIDLTAEATVELGSVLLQT